MIDLHTHSTHSDGSDPPGRLAALGLKRNLYALALTDHDTISGIGEFLTAGQGAKIKTLAGLEISLDYGKTSLHMLGYLYDPQHKPLTESLRAIREGRAERNAKIVGKLQQCGVDISLDEVESAAGGEVVGRPHFAKILVRKKAAASFSEAFDRFLSKGAAAYVDRFRLSLKDGVGLLREAGGAPVLAHPGLLQLAPGESLRELVRRLTDYGLLGLEVWYTLHGEWQTRDLKALADEFGLIATGGSDYHGANKKNIQLGKGLGRLYVPNEAADRLLEATRTDLSKCSNIKESGDRRL